LLESLGHTLIEDRPRFDWEAFLENVHVIWAAFGVASIDFAAAMTGRKPGPDTLEAVTLASYEDGKRYSAIDLLNAITHCNPCRARSARSSKRWTYSSPQPYRAYPRHWVSSIRTARG
jgi:amidase